MTGSVSMRLHKKAKKVLQNRNTKRNLSRILNEITTLNKVGTF